MRCEVIALVCAIRNYQGMPDDSATYVERYRWTPTIGIGIALALAFVAIGVFAVPPLIIRIPVVAFFGWAALFSIATVLSRKVALRVDEAGITFGGGVFRYNETTRFHRWADVEAITLWQRYIPLTIGRWSPFAFGPIHYIGVRRRPGAPPITPGGRGRADWPAFMAPATGVAAGAARSATAFVIDEARLARAVAAFAPAVPIETGATVGKPKSRKAPQRKAAN
jgi:hypothetical protein